MTDRAFFPRQVGALPKPQPEIDERYRWDLRPYILKVNGYPREFFTIGHLAGALTRSAMTIRGWEAKGQFPKPMFTINGSEPRRRRRLYTRQQIEGVLQIAQEEGILENARRYLGQTQFTERCFDLFQQLGRDVPPPIEKENA